MKRREILCSSIIFSGRIQPVVPYTIRLQSVKRERAMSNARGHCTKGVSMQVLWGVGCRNADFTQTPVSSIPGVGEYVLMEEPQTAAFTASSSQFKITHLKTCLTSISYKIA
jgi:hypothetical protein